MKQTQTSKEVWPPYSPENFMELASSNIEMKKELGDFDYKLDQCERQSQSLIEENKRLKEAIEKICDEWERQKNLFPILGTDGWMNLAINNAKNI